MPTTKATTLAHTLASTTSSTADLNYAKTLNDTGVTSTEFDKLDGLTATTNELNLVDGSVTGPLSHRNIIINGEFKINQAGNKTGKTSGEKQMAGDRWSFDTNIGTWSGGTENDAPTGSGFVSSGYFNCTSQATTGSGGYCIVSTRFEGQDLQHIRKGTSSAKPVTLSFWVKSPTTGTHICELYDGDNTRHCSQSYTISSANTWEYKSVTFPADTTGAFDNDNGLSLYVQWWLGAGTSYTSGTLQTTWGNNTAANRAVGQVNVGGTAHSSNNYFQLTGVQLELGSVATPFEHRGYGEELFRCQRYFYAIHKVNDGGQYMFTGYFWDTGQGLANFQPPVSMRTSPSVISPNVTDSLRFWVAGSGNSFDYLTLNGATPQNVNMTMQGEGTGTAGNAGGVSANNDSNYLYLTAEL